MKKEQATLNGVWQFKVDSLDRGVRGEWFRKGYDRSEWQQVNVPEYWDRYNLATYDGAGWYARTFPTPDTINPYSVFFAGVDDDADVWVNGTKVGAHIGYSESFYFDVTEALQRGVNEIVVRVEDHGGPGGIYRPITLVRSDRVGELLRGKYSEVPARRSAEWVRDALIYEVYVRSFSKEGSLKALERRIPELKGLGVTVLWLMPIHPVGELNRKGKLGSPYAVQDYYAVNEEFGTLDDFRSFVKTVHSNGMKIIIDLVANHTSWDSKLMIDHPDWFTKNEDGAIVSPNDDWTDVADLNYEHHELRKYMIEMMKYWVRDVGIDGYRCDVAELVPTDFWNTARKELDKIKPVMMLSEGTLPELHVEAFDLTYSWNVYDVLGKVIHGSTPARVFDELYRNEVYQFPKGSLRLRFNTNHDKNAWDAPAVEKFTPQGSKATAVLVFTFPGVPLLYNGEEVGNDRRLNLFENVEIDWSKGKDFRKLFTELSRLRRDHACVRSGEYQMLANTGNEKVYSFLRRDSRDTVVTVINFSKKIQDLGIVVPQGIPDRWTEYFLKEDFRVDNGLLKLKLPALGYAVFVQPK